MEVDNLQPFREMTHSRFIAHHWWISLIVLDYIIFLIVQEILKYFTRTIMSSSSRHTMTFEKAPLIVHPGLGI